MLRAVFTMIESVTAGATVEAVFEIFEKNQIKDQNPPVPHDGLANA